MGFEAILVLTVLAVALWPLVVLKRRGLALSLVLVVVCLVSVAWLTIGHRKPVSQRYSQHRPIEVEGGGYVTLKTCRACQARHYETWHESYHRTMTQVATPETVFAPFENIELELDTPKYRLEHRDEEFCEQMPAPGPELRSTLQGQCQELPGRRLSGL